MPHKGSYGSSGKGTMKYKSTGRTYAKEGAAKSSDASEKKSYPKFERKHYAHPRAPNKKT